MKYNVVVVTFYSLHYQSQTLNHTLVVHLRASKCCHKMFFELLALSVIRKPRMGQYGSTF